jgi:hypothetical protein
MFGLVTATQDKLAHWLDGSRTAALLKKRDELTARQQREMDDLPAVQSELGAALKDETAIRASALIGDAGPQDVKKAEKVTASARERVTRLEQSIAAPRAAIAQIDEQLPEVERADRGRHARDVIQPRFEEIVKRLTAKMLAAGEDMRELEILSREIRDQYPTDYLVPEQFKPVGAYLDPDSPKVLTDMTWPDMTLPEPGSERATKLSTWLKAWQDAGHKV